MPIILDPTTNVFCITVLMENCSNGLDSYSGFLSSILEMNVVRECYKMVRCS